MKIFQKYRYECFAIVLTSAFSVISFYLGIADPAEKSVRSALFAACVADAIGLYFTLRKLWRTKWKKLFLTSVQKIITKIAKRLKFFIEKRIKRKKKTVLSGKTTVTFDLSLQEFDKQKSHKAIKWKRLKNDRERLGYLYKHMIESKIKHGSVIYSSETPIEIKYKKENEIFEDQIFELYISNRYNSVVQIDADTLNELKKICN